MLLLLLEVGQGKRKPNDTEVLKAAARSVRLHAKNN
jgi:hypothetical protein